MGSIYSPLIRNGHQRGLTSKGTGGHQKGRASKGSGMNSSFGPQKGRASIGTDIKRDWHQWGRASKGTADINWDGHQSGLASNGPPWHQSGRASMRSASIGPASIGWHQSGVVQSICAWLCGSRKFCRKADWGQLWWNSESFSKYWLHSYCLWFLVFPITTYVLCRNKEDYQYKLVSICAWKQY